ncbi:MAG: TIGR03619 family F420-dependent LLM class oxidoreductase [Proteobacteria bacterium]|nr:TIGR03619 family F420-dependent LLM class oxidoreductase [Pseudomonadota bacterium]HQR02978.1 TIGR03619 family F420-dependent LLM class oxidoreductase [Rhodocyclaceae bacterium]
MKFWQMLTWMEPEQMMDIARFAEELGFKGVMLGDHGVYPRDVKAVYPYSADGKPPMKADDYYPDCWVSIAAMAAVTRRIKFSVSVYVLPLRNVFEVARATGTLGLLSGNRLILGAGIGWMKDEYDIYGIDFRTRGKRFDEMIDALRLLWQGGMVEYHGQHIDFPALQISPAPPQPVPIYTGGASAPALARAATKADGWIGAGNLPDEVPTLMAELHRLRKEAGRDHLPFRTVAGLKSPPDRATFQRLEEAGMTDGVSYPFFYTVGQRSSVDEKKRAMEKFAQDIIRHCS